MPVLDGELHRDPEPLPVTRGLGNVITDLLGGLRRKHKLLSGKPLFGSQQGTPTLQQNPSPLQFLLLHCKIGKKSFFSSSHVAGAPMATQDTLQPGLPPPAGSAPSSLPASAQRGLRPSQEPPAVPPTARPMPRNVPDRAGRSWGPEQRWRRPPRRCSAGTLRAQHGRQPRCNGPGRRPPPSRPSLGRSPPRSHRHPRGNGPGSLIPAPAALTARPRPLPAPLLPPPRHVPTLISLGSNLGGMAAARGADGGGCCEGCGLAGRRAERDRAPRGRLIYPPRSREMTALRGPRPPLP